MQRASRSHAWLDGSRCWNGPQPLLAVATIVQLWAEAELYWNLHGIQGHACQPNLLVLCRISELTYLTSVRNSEGLHLAFHEVQLFKLDLQNPMGSVSELN